MFHVTSPTGSQIDCDTAEEAASLDAHFVGKQVPPAPPAQTTTKSVAAKSVPVTGTPIPGKPKPTENWQNAFETKHCTLGNARILKRGSDGKAISWASSGAKPRKKNGRKMKLRLSARDAFCIHALNRRGIARYKIRKALCINDDSDLKFVDDLIGGKTYPESKTHFDAIWNQA